MSYLKKVTKNLKLIIIAMLLLIITTSLVYASDGVFDDVCNVVGVCRHTSNTEGIAFKGTSLTNIGIYGTSATDIAVYGESQSSTLGAVRGYHTGTNGVGVWGRGLYYIGVRGTGGTGSGDYGGYFTGFYGTRGIASGSNGQGTSGVASGVSGTGAYGLSTQYIGVRGVSTGTDAGDYGGHFFSTRRGLYANGAEGDYDGVFPNCISVDLTLYGHCAPVPLNTLSSGMSLRAVNNDNEALVPGDVVVFNGVTTVEGLARPILLVKKASGAAGEAVIGVVQSAYVQEAPAVVEAADNNSEAVEPAGSPVEGEIPPDFTVAQVSVADFPIDNPDDAGHFVAGNVQPGQQLFVQVQGIALVNVDASITAIVAGESLVASPTGNAVTAPPRLNTTANGLVIGRALESLASGKEAIYVLLGVR